MKRRNSLFLAIILLSSCFPSTSYAIETEISQESRPSEEMETEEGKEDISETDSKAEESTETSEQPKESETLSSNEQVVPSESTYQESEPDVEEPRERREDQFLISEETCQFSVEKNATTEEFIGKIGEAARTVGQKNNLYASVMIAQAILESGSGSSQLSQEPNNNLFGIKGAYEGSSVVYGTWEDEGEGNSYTTDASFSVYPSVKESFEDYALLLTEGLATNSAFYQEAWKSQTTSYQEATKALTGTYATDIRYNEKLNTLIETYNLTTYDCEKETILVGGEFEPYNNVNYDTGNSYAFGNCTQYVYNRITQLGGHIDLDMGNGKEWGLTGRERGYDVSHIPKAGTAISFNASVLGADATYGHVGFVEKVNEDGSILISEMNVQGLNVVSTRIIESTYTGMATYISPK